MPSSWLLISDATVITGLGDVQTSTSVLIRNDLIHSVGAEADRSAVPRGDVIEEITASGRTVMPGLVDVHCHVTYGESRSEEEIDLYTSPELRTLKAAWNAQKILRAGVTGISNPGGSYYIGVGLREAVRDGFVLGPRMTSAGRYISTSNSLTDWYPDSVGVPQGSIGTLANTLPEMINELRHQLKNGVDFIKLADSPMGEFQAFTLDELKQLTDLAHQHGKKITIHARGPGEVHAAVRAGMDWIMHGNVMTDDVIEDLAAAQIPLVPTLLLLGNVAEWGLRVGAPAPLRAAFSEMLEKTAVTLHRAHEAGVVMVAGTDTGFAVTPYGEWHARELELLVEYAGLSPMEAIQSATRNAAPMLNLEGKIGVIAPGMIADVIIVAGNPLQDLRVLQDKKKIVHVIKNGKRVDFDEDAIKRRWPHQRGMRTSLADLTYDLIYGEPEASSATPEQSPLWEAEQAVEIVQELERREQSVRQHTS
jgi:imidazolonepropionase-like amidohydrolase